MADCNRCAKINVKVLFILILIAVALGTSLIAARHVRRRLRSEMELKAGLAAFDKMEWKAANGHLSNYISLNPDDVEILKKLAEARMSIRPTSSGLIAGAIAAYRRALQLDPGYEEAYGQLATLYKSVGNFEELEFFALKRINLNPDEFDREAQMWLADARIRLGKFDGAAAADPDEDKRGARQILEGIIAELEPAEPEYVQACIRMSSLPVLGSSPDAKTPLDWLNDALEASDPNSVEALALRARLHREKARERNMSDVQKRNLLELARADLEDADKTGTDNMQIRAFLCAEWMQHGELKEAAAELEFVESLSEATMKEQFLDIKEWEVTRFILASELAMLGQEPAEAASLADEALTNLTEDRYRNRILDNAIRSYVVAGKVEDANDRLAEYIDAMRGVPPTTEGDLRTAYLKAMVARVKGLPYAVINILQPILVEGVPSPELWRLLAEAYSMTGQPRRAITALERYLVLQPNDSQIRLLKVAEHIKLRDWVAVREDAQRLELISPVGTDARLVAQKLRIEASAYIAVARGQSGATKLKDLSKELADLRDQHPDRVDIRVLQAVVAGYLEQPEIDAEDQLKQAIEDSEGLEKLRARMQLVRYYRSKQDPKAVSECERACVEYPELAEPLLVLSELHVANADPNSAHDVLVKGLKPGADAAEERKVIMKLALLELTQGNRAAGKKRLKDLADQDKGDVEVRSLLLSLLDVSKEKNWPRAGELIGELKKAEGEGGVFWRYHQARLWRESLSDDEKRSREAEIARDLQYCIDADPMWSAPVLLLGNIQSDLGHSQDAEYTYRRALAKDSTGPGALLNLLALLQRHKRLGDAKQLLARLVDQFKISRQAASDLNIGMALGAKDYDRAIEELKLRVLGEPNNVDVLSSLARQVYERDKDVDQAYEYLDEAARQDPNSIAMIMAKAVILKAQGKAEEAWKELDDYVTRVAGDEALRANAEMLKAEFLAAWGEIDKAVETFDKGREAYSDDLRPKRGLMKTLYTRRGDGDVARADGILKELEEQLPNDPELFTIRAGRLLEQAALLKDRTAADAKRAEAEKKLRRAVRIEPAAINAHLLLIGIFMDKEEYETARDLSIRAIDSNPNRPELTWARARVELALENAEFASQNAMLAAEQAERALERDPNNPALLNILVAAAMRSMNKDLCQKAITKMEAYCAAEEGRTGISETVALADLYRLTGDADLARQWLEEAEQIDPTNQIVVHARFLLLAAERRFDELAQIASAYIRAKEQNPATVVDAASTLIALNSRELLEEAIKLFEYALTISPELPSARFGLASARYRAGDIEVAKKLYGELLAQDPDNARILNDLAWILQEHDKDYNAAIELVDRGLWAAGDDVVRCHLLDTRGTILLKLNRSADARKDFERLLTLSPTPTQEARTHLELGRICEKLGESAKARQHLERALALDPQNDIFTDDERSEISRILQGSGI